jgi:hypothetical protein
MIHKDAGVLARLTMPCPSRSVVNSFARIHHTGVTTRRPDLGRIYSPPTSTHACLMGNRRRSGPRLLLRRGLVTHDALHHSHPSPIAPWAFFCFRFPLAKAVKVVVRCLARALEPWRDAWARLSPAWLPTYGSRMRCRKAKPRASPQPERSAFHLWLSKRGPVGVSLKGLSYTLHPSFYPTLREEEVGRNRPSQGCRARRC